MSRRKDISESKSATATQPDAAPAEPEIKNELPLVGSPSISPATDAFAGPAEPAPEIEPAPAIAAQFAAPVAARSRLALSRRQKRSALFAASVALAAVIGAVIGAMANASFAPLPPKTNAATLSEREAMQKTIAHLSKEVAIVKTAGINAANKAAKEIAVLKSSLDTANKSASAQVGRVAERVDRIERQAKAAASETTGSISAKRTVTETKAPPAPARPQVVKGWVVRGARNGLVYVEGRSGIYQVVPGAALPGLGPVETIKREDGHWVVVTPKGIIVSMRDRPYFAPY